MPAILACHLFKAYFCIFFYVPLWRWLVCLLWVTLCWRKMCLPLYWNQVNMSSSSSLPPCFLHTVKSKRERLPEEVCRRGQALRGTGEDFLWVFWTFSSHIYSHLVRFLFGPPFDLVCLLSAFLEQEINRSLSPPLQQPLTPPCPTPLAPQPRELITIEEESERLARELKEVGGGSKQWRMIKLNDCLECHYWYTHLWKTPELLSAFFFLICVSE